MAQQTAVVSLPPIWRGLTHALSEQPFDQLSLAQARV